jgi:hypothetical protein
MKSNGFFLELPAWSFEALVAALTASFMVVPAAGELPRSKP